MSQVWERLWFAGVLAALISGVWLLHALATPGVQFTHVQSSSIATLAEMYFGREAGKYHAHDRMAWHVPPDAWGTLQARPDPRPRIESLRIDPQQTQGRVLIEAVGLSSRWGEMTLRGADLIQSAHRLNDVEFGAYTEDGVELFSMGMDPHFSIHVPAWLYAPSRTVLVSLWFQIFVFLLTLWLLAELASRLLPLHWLEAIRTRPGAAAAFVGGRARERPAQIILVVSLLALPALFYWHVQVATLTPPFQGPDEGAHIANSFQGFHHLMHGERPDCDQTWGDLNSVQDHLGKLVRRSSVRLGLEDMTYLSSSKEVSSWSSPVRWEPARHSCCSCSNLVHVYVYNAFSFPFLLFSADHSAISYVSALRLGQSLFAFTLFVLIIVIIARGRFVAPGWADLDVGILRVFVFFGMLFYIGIPQSVFMLSVVNAEAYLVPVGIFIFVSFLFYHRWLTPILFLLAAYTLLSRKIVYLPLLMLLVSWYVSLWMARKKNSSVPAYALSALVATVVLVFPLALRVFSEGGHSLGGVALSTLKLIESPSHYYAELASQISYIYSLGFLNGTWFFGRFGWLDTYHPGEGAILYRSVFFLLGAWFLVSMVRVFRSSSYHYSGLDGGHLAWSTIIFFVFTLPILVALVAYGIFESLYSYCSPPRWGCGVQGRYFLPIYFFAFVYWIAVGGGVYVVKAERSLDRQLGAFVIALLVGGIIVVGINAAWMLEALGERYFIDEGVLGRYLEVIRG